MAKQKSPFAALSAREQQEKWLEFQSGRMPYIASAIDGDTPAIEENKAEPNREKSKEEISHPQTGAPTPAPVAKWRQLPRHGQYDRVLRRMRDAGRQATQFQPVK